MNERAILLNKRLALIFIFSFGVLSFRELFQSSICYSADKFEYTKQAEFDEQGNIFVSSNEGKLIKMADTKRCSRAEVANDKQTVGCTVTRGLKSEEFSQPLQL